MNGSAVVVGLACALAGCSCLYLASPHQLWRAVPWPARPARAAGALLLAASLAAFLQAMQAAPAVFTFVACLMLLLVVLPYLGALVSLRRGSARRGH
ncbi:MAG: hypothetical protein J0H00_06705 [Burkholderiales bacterium]|nr:hypothetical protein [Burkholderiales bacterium]OJX06592.1 MAG: hypothetical protein BGO72_16410 [Burkholderiales bacterium 70-64]